MRPANTESSFRRDHSTFDSELSGAVLNLQLFRRIMKWLKPYRVTLLISLMLILIASYLTVIMEIMISRVLVLSLIHI